MGQKVKVKGAGWQNDMVQNDMVSDMVQNGTRGAGESLALLATGDWELAA